MGEIRYCGYALEGCVLVLASSCYFSLLPGYYKVFFSTFFLCDVLPHSPGPRNKAVSQAWAEISETRMCHSFPQVVSWVLCHSEENANTKITNAPAHVQPHLGGTEDAPKSVPFEILRRSHP